MGGPLPLREAVVGPRLNRPLALPVAVLPLSSTLQIRRPNNYDITLALMLGPTDPNPAMEVSQGRSTSAQHEAQHGRTARPALAAACCISACRRAARRPRRGRRRSERLTVRPPPPASPARPPPPRFPPRPP